MSRRKRQALVAGACALALFVLHFGWFVFFGPPEWFAGVHERAPQMTAVRLGSNFDRYLEEFDRPRKASLASREPVSHEGVVGRVVREDRVPDGGPALLQTRDESGDRLYGRQAGSDVWQRLPLPSAGRAGEARWVRTDDGYRVLLARSLAWWPLDGKYGRFWGALRNPALRPDSGLFLLQPETGGARYLFPGRMPLPSPDRGAVAFLRSERRGLHSLHLWRGAGDEAVTVASLWEADPGSGPSFYWSWSSDSKVLFVRGTARGFEGNPTRAAHEIRLLYDVAGDRLVDLR